MTTLPSRHNAEYMKMSPIEKCIYLTKKTKSCWFWQGKPDAYGYGTIKVNGRTWKAHRLMYTLLASPIKDEKHIDHLCRNRMCVNPSHLEPVTNRENILRGFGRGAVEARMTICTNGHPLSGKNLYVSPGSKKRRCRKCSAETAKAWRLRKFSMSKEEYQALKIEA